MDENPYKSPQVHSDVAEKGRSFWPVAWGAVGFAVGIMAVSMLALNVDSWQSIAGSAICGGLPGGLIGMIFGLERNAST